MSLKIIHDLSKLSKEELEQYKSEVSNYIGLPPELNALDTIWMQNESGPGQSLVLYARRGTAEILRDTNKINITSLTQETIGGSIVFTAKGTNSAGRQEIAAGSKFTGSLTGKALDDAIMTASTRALRRVTMQFVKLGILDESEVSAIKGDTSNPAVGATLAGSPVVMPPVPTVAPNNGPGRDITPVPCLSAAPVLIDQKTNIVKVYEEGAKALAAMQTPASAKTSAISDGPNPELQSHEQVTPAPEAAKEAVKPRRGRKPRNTVNMDGPEPEVVSTPASASQVAPQPTPVPPATFSGTPHEALTSPTPMIQTPEAVPAPGTSVPNQGTDFPGKPNGEQMADYRKRVSVYTSELPSSENMGSVQKMRAFISKMSGNPPQYMTVEQWQDMLAWFEQFVVTNKMKGLLKYINDSLGVK